MDNKLLTVDEAATFLQISPRSLYEWCRSGEIKFTKIGRQIRFRTSWLLEYAEENSNGFEQEINRPFSGHVTEISGPLLVTAVIGGNKK